jgi:aldehyde dehydrogenase
MAVTDLVKQTSIQQALDTLRQGGVKSKYENFIGGCWVAPLKGQYFTDHSPINGEPICEIARSSAEDIEKALDAAHAVKNLWGRTSPADRAGVLLKIAEKMEENLELLALAETLDNGKPIRETRAADVPLAIDHFRYFASCIRAEEGAVSEIDNDTIAYHFKEPLGVVGQIIPWNFPLLMAAWKSAKRWPPTRGLRKSASPAKPQPVGSSCNTPRNLLFRRPWSWAENPRTSSSRT